MHVKATYKTSTVVSQMSAHGWSTLQVCQGGSEYLL